MNGAARNSEAGGEMAKISWSTTGQRLYSTGIDRGVFYPEDGSAGVPWSGLASITASPKAADAQENYLDGQKVLNIPAGEDFQATIEAFSAPPEFAICAGRLLLATGLYATDQPKETFGFSYRTIVGNDVLGTAFAYKVHVVYGALAKISDFTNASITDTPSAKTYSWDITTVPVAATSFRPTAHIVADSRLISSDHMSSIETILYGDDDHDPRMPTTTELIPLLAS
jgi:hypothetical protein